MTEFYHRDFCISRFIFVAKQGNVTGYERDEESISKYSVFQTTLKTDPNKDMKEEVEAIFKNNKVERSGHITAIGDYRAVSSYSIQITDGLFNGQFWIKQDTHTFSEGQHEMKLEIEFENEMNKEEIPQKKDDKKTNSNKRQRKNLE